MQPSPNLCRYEQFIYMLTGDRTQDEADPRRPGKTQKLQGNYIPYIAVDKTLLVVGLRCSI